MDGRQRDMLDSRELVLAKVIDLGLSFKFLAWLEKNWAIWDEFKHLADQMRHRGRQYYSARAVIHVLRWHRALQDPTDAEYKINNCWSANMARLYNGLVGHEFFRTRDRD